MNYQNDLQKRINAARDLLFDSSITSAKLASVRTLIAGVHPSLDNALAQCEKDLSTFEKMCQGDVVLVGAENLPEYTKEEKNRKKYLLLFIKSWRQLKSEVERVQKELDAGGEGNSTSSEGSRWARVFRVAKGTLGLTTLAAVGIVLTLKATAVTIVITNKGCGPIALAPLNISFPGFSVPKETIPTNGWAIAKLSPLSADIDATNDTTISIKILGFTGSYEIPNNINDIIFNGTSLLGTKTHIRLLDRKEHALVFTCK